MLSTLSTATMCGVAGHAVTVEVHVADGLPGYSIVGLPDTTCRESRDRVRAAIMSCRPPMAEQAHHGEPGAVRRAQARSGPRPRHRSRGARGIRATARARPPATGGHRVPRRARPRRNRPSRRRCAAHGGGARGGRGRGGAVERGRGRAGRATRRAPDRTPPRPDRGAGRRRTVVRPARGRGAGARTVSARPEPGQGATVRAGWRSRCRPLAGITCCWWARPEPARRCSPNASSGSCPTSRPIMPSR